MEKSSVGILLCKDAHSVNFSVLERSCLMISESTICGRVSVLFIYNIQSCKAKKVRNLEIQWHPVPLRSVMSSTRFLPRSFFRGRK